jgi:hypothetical protein
MKTIDHVALVLAYGGLSTRHPSLTMPNSGPRP